MSRWDDISTVPVYGSGNPLGEGVHHLKIIKTFEKTSTKPGAEEFFIAELEVLRSNNPTHVVGSTRSWVVNYKHPSSKSNVKSFVLGVTDFTEETLTPKAMLFVISEANPLCGVEIMAEGTIVKTQKGGDYTKFKWEKAVSEPVVATTPAAAAVTTPTNVQ